MFSFKNIVFAIAIFILTIAVSVYGVNTLYGASPSYEDYCPIFLNNQTVCESEGGTWINDSVVVIDREIPAKAVNGGYCNYDYSLCQEELKNAERKYFRNVFFIALPLGIIIIAVGALVFGLETVGAGLMAGGVGVVLYGVGGFWRFADELLKFILSLIGLIAVIWLSYYANRKWSKK